MNTNSRMLIFQLTGGLVLILVLAAFALSYGAVYELAVSYHWPAWAAYVSPLMLDFFVIVGKMDILRRSQDKVRTWYPWTLVIVFSALAVLFNVLHMTPTNWTPADMGKQVFAALPPVVVLLAFHLFVAQVKDRMLIPVPPKKVSKPLVPETKPAVLPEPSVPANVQPLVQSVSEVQERLDKANQVRQATVEERRTALPGLLSAGLTVADLAARFEVSAKTIRRDIVALNGSVKVN